MLLGFMYTKPKPKPKHRTARARAPLPPPRPAPPHGQPLAALLATRRNSPPQHQLAGAGGLQCTARYEPLGRLQASLEGRDSWTSDCGELLGLSRGWLGPHLAQSVQSGRCIVRTDRGCAHRAARQPCAAAAHEQHVAGVCVAQQRV